MHVLILECYGTKSLVKETKNSQTKTPQHFIARMEYHILKMIFKGCKPQLGFDQRVSNLINKLKSLRTLLQVLGCRNSKKLRSKSSSKRQRNRIRYSSRLGIRKTVNKWNKISVRTYNQAYCFPTLLKE